MIQLNLLPDVKLDYIKAQRSRSMVVTISVVVTIVSVGILVSLLSIGAIQKKHLADLNDDITKKTTKLQSQPNIDQILTVQNQLDSLTALHDAKPATSRLFKYLNDVTPVQASITSFTTDYTTQAATITGTADSLSTVNKYVDTLKFTTFTSDKSDTKAKAFTGVVMSSFALTSETKVGGHPATFTITLVYDVSIFDTTQKIRLSVPNKITTRSQVQQAAELFTAAPVVDSKIKGSN